MSEISRWFLHGEPTGDGRVEAEIRRHYSTGPNEPERGPDLIEGTVGFEALAYMDESEEIKRHTHEDGSVLLSALDDEVEEELLETFQKKDELETDGGRKLRTPLTPASTKAELASTVSSHALDTIEAGGPEADEIADALREVADVIDTDD